MIKSGIGYDVHQLQEGEKLIIGGVEIDSNFGSVGHSDGDGLIHAIVDALLGAAAAGDIGMYFPSDSNEWKNATSSVFLEKAVEVVGLKGFKITHVDSIIILQEPKLRPYIEEIRKRLSTLMNIDIGSVSVKATTTDHLGFEGKGTGWSAQAIATLESA